MRIVVASGKGGAGKTSIAASLVVTWPRPVVAVDADVEAPNLHLLLHPELTASRPAFLTVPEAGEGCTLCGRCRDICRYKAIGRFAARMLFFPDMCHGCGGCFAVCAAGALREGRRELGTLETGTAGAARFLMGRSRIGEAMTPPLLRALHAALDALLEECPADAIVDAPPGVSCPAMTVAREADMVVLAAEPTPFGFHDFRLAHEAFRQVDVPLAVTINRAGMEGNAAGDAEVRRYCTDNGLPLLPEIPFSRAVAEDYARGGAPAGLSPEWAALFTRLGAAVRQCAGEVRHA